MGEEKGAETDPKLTKLIPNERECPYCGKHQKATGSLLATEGYDDEMQEIKCRVCGGSWYKAPPIDLKKLRAT